ncbi:MAG: HNH endonuclease signature motif containing protein [Terriglobia bacterium]
MSRHINYRRLAFGKYDPICVLCGFGIPALLEVAHLDGNRENNSVRNLVILCPTCHKMYDLDLVIEATIRQMRDRPRPVKWSKRMKDAGKKARETRERNQAKLRDELQKAKQSAAGRKAATTRRRRAGARKAAETRRRTVSK